MLENGKINNRQFTIFIILFIIGSSILILPAGLATEAKQDAWIGAILSMGMGLLLIPIYIALGNQYPGLTLTEISENILGKWAGKAISLLFVTFAFFLASLVLRNIGDFVITQVMTETPIQFIHILFLIIVVLGVRLGLEVLARTAEVFFPWIAIMLILLICALLPIADLSKIQPVFEGGIKPIMRASILMIGTPFLELVVFLMIVPYVNQTINKRKSFFTGVLIAGFALILITALCILVLGPDFTAKQMYPSYTLAKKINIGGFLQRIEVLMAGIWLLTIFFKTTICFYAATMGLANVLTLKDYRPLILPLAMIMQVLSIVAYPNSTYFIIFASKIWPFYALTFGLFIPLTLLGIGKIRKKLG